MRRLLLGLGAVALAVTSCATERPTRSFVQPNYVAKTDFDGQWYMRQTVADVPPTTGFAFVGYASGLEKIRWEIQEKFLVAYRSYELIPGSTAEADPTNVGTNATRYAEGQAEGRSAGFKEGVVAAYPIEKHFDIFRQYNTTTGEEINTIEENDKDRPWYERKYMRVDWSKNEVVNFNMLVFGDENGNAIGVAGKWYVQDSEGGRDKFRLERKKDTAGNDVAYYMDFVTKLHVNPSYYGCLLTWYGFAAEDCTSAEVGVRTSFLKVEEREFEPVVYDDHKQTKFGYFRTERLTYDRGRGVTETGRIFLANIHNIFAKSFARDAQGNIRYKDGTGENAKDVFYTEAIGFHYRNADGSPQRDASGRLVVPAKVKPQYIPRDQRPLKPVVYHLSPRYPREMIRGAELVAESWNRAFRRAAAAATKKELSQIPDMFILNYNGWVKKVAGKELADYRPERDKDLAGQSVTWTYDPSREVAFAGDLRFNVIYWVHQPQISGPLGYGPSAADPETGEIVSGTAYVYGAAVDTYATTALDTVRLLANQQPLNEFVTGQAVRDYINANFSNADPRRRVSADLMDLPLPEAKARMLGPKKLAKLEAIRRFGLEPARAGRTATVMQRIKDAGLDSLLINDEIRRTFTKGRFQIGQPLTAAEKAKIDITSWASAEGLKARMQKRWALALKHNITLAEFVDDSIIGLAMQYADRPSQDLRDQGPVWQELREAIYRGVMEHEVGHTVGLRHNFQGSFDSVNYHDGYWDLRKENIKPASQIRRLSDAIAMATQTEAMKQGRMNELQYSSIMDYGARFNSDIHGIGKYDEAAVLFAYADAVEVFEVDRNTLDSETVELVEWSANRPSPLYDALPEMVHYTQLPVRFGGGDLDAGVAALRSRRVVSFSELQELRRQNEQEGATHEIPLEVPYMFCSDYMVGALASCQMWDQGADHNEIVQDMISRYQNYYFFNNYKRDRYAFDPYMVLERVYGRYLSYLPNLYQHWLFSQFYSSSVDGLGDLYWTMSTFDGLNLISDIMTMPEYGSYDCSGVTCDLVSYSMGRANVDVAIGPGRRQYSRYDIDSGSEILETRVVEAGHFWDYLAAVFAITTTDATVVGVETVSDFTSYVIPYYLVFEEETTKLVNGLYARDYEAIAPRINNGQLVRYPAVDINGTNAAPPGKPVNLDVNFTSQIYAMLYAMAFFTSSYSLHFPDQAQVFRLGAGEQVNPGEGFRLEQFTDPLTGHAYGALVRTTGTTTTLAAKMILKGKDIATRYQTLKAQMGENPSPSDPRYRQLQQLEYDMSSHVEDLNVLRGLYDVLARTM